jgi:hypothetical protein
MRWQRYFRPSLTVLWELLCDGLQFLNVVARSRTAVAAEVLFLRKQLAYYRDHQIRPRRLSDAARLSLGLWSRLFDWKEALMVVTPGPLCAGIARVSSGIGAGSHAAADQRFPRTYASSSLAWCAHNKGLPSVPARTATLQPGTRHSGEILGQRFDRTEKPQAPIATRLSDQSEGHPRRPTSRILAGAARRLSVGGFCGEHVFDFSQFVRK